MATFTVRWYDEATSELITGDVSAHDAYAAAFCGQDGSAVAISQVGTSQYARCEQGHRWQQTFGPAPRWMAVAPWTQSGDSAALICQRCGHTWQSRTARPVRCPACSSTAWDRPRA